VKKFEEAYARSRSSALPPQRRQLTNHKSYTQKRNRNYPIKATARLLLNSLVGWHRSIHMSPVFRGQNLVLGSSGCWYESRQTLPAAQRILTQVPWPEPAPVGLILTLSLRKGVPTSPGPRPSRSLRSLRETKPLALIYISSLARPKALANENLPVDAIVGCPSVLELQDPTRLRGVVLGDLQTGTAVTHPVETSNSTRVDSPGGSAGLALADAIGAKVARASRRTIDKDRHGAPVVEVEGASQSSGGQGGENGKNKAHFCVRSLKKSRT